MDFKVLESKRLVYNMFSEEDYDDLVDVLHNEEVCKYLPGPKVYPKDIIKKWLQFFINSFDTQKPNLYYAIREKGYNKIIGYCAMNWIPEFETNEITYVLHEKYWGLGYATEAAQKMMELAKLLGVKHMVSLAMVGNKASSHILEKMGFTYEKDVQLWGVDLHLYRQTL